MKYIRTFEEFVNESRLNEAADLSPDLVKVKSAGELAQVVGKRKLVIISKHSINNTKKRGGQWPQMNVIYKMDTDSPRIYDIGAHSNFSALDLQHVAYDMSSWSINWTIADIYQFFIFNKKRGNKIYIVDELPIKKDILPLVDKVKNNISDLRSILGKPSYIIKGKVDGAKFVVWSPIQGYHGKQRIEFTYKGKGYSYIFNVYGSDIPQLFDGRSTVRAGYTRDEEIYVIDPKNAKAIYDLLEPNEELYKKGIKIGNDFVKKEEVSKAK